MKDIFLIVTLIFLSACDGSFVVRRDIDKGVKINRECIRTAMEVVTAKNTITEKSGVEGQYFIGQTKIYIGKHFVQAIYAKANREPGVELKAFGRVAPSKKAQDQYRLAGAAVLDKLANEIKVRCDTTAHVVR